MSVKSKTVLKADNDANITTNGVGDITGLILNSQLEDFVDSWQDVITSYTTVNRDLLTGMSTGLIIYNTTNERNEYYDGTSWLAVGDTKKADYVYWKGTGNTDLTANETGDIRIGVNGSGNMAIEKLDGAWEQIVEFT